MITEIELLNEEECSSVAADVHACREQWNRLRFDVPFFMLGAAAYIDARCEHEASYRKKAEQLNPLLHQQFGWVHERLVQQLATVLHQPVQLHPRFGLPGFHIWQYNEALRHHRPLPHIDDPLLFVDWLSGKPLTFEDQVSVTLPIRLPSGGAGLNWWDLAPDQVHGKERAALASLITKQNRRFHPYTVGRACLHTKPRLHQLQLGEQWQPSDERITLQCFAVSVRGAWQVFF